MIENRESSAAPPAGAVVGTICGVCARAIVAGAAIIVSDQQIANANFSAPDE